MIYCLGWSSNAPIEHSCLDWIMKPGRGIDGLVGFLLSLEELLFSDADIVVYPRLPDFEAFAQQSSDVYMFLTDLFREAAHRTDGHKSGTSRWVTIDHQSLSDRPYLRADVFLRNATRETYEVLVPAFSLEQVAPRRDAQSANDRPAVPDKRSVLDPERVRSFIQNGIRARRICRADRLQQLSKALAWPESKVQVVVAQAERGEYAADSIEERNALKAAMFDLSKLDVTPERIASQLFGWTPDHLNRQLRTHGLPSLKSMIREMQVIHVKSALASDVSLEELAEDLGMNRRYLTAWLQRNVRSRGSEK